MGWTYMNKDKGVGIKDFFSKRFNSDSDGKTIRVIDCSSTISEAYMAVEVNTGSEHEVFAVVCCINHRPKDYYNFGYKDMVEDTGPYYYNCPERILKLLTPTESKYACEWRAKCWENIARRKSRPSFRVGDTIDFENPVSFRNGWNLKRFKVTNKRKLLFESPDVGNVSFKLSKRSFDNIPYVVNSCKP